MLNLFLKRPQGLFAALAYRLAESGCGISEGGGVGWD